MERNLHDLGYRYTGQGSLYALTWHEIFNLSDASELIADQAEGVSDHALSKFEEFDRKARGL